MQRFLSLFGFGLIVVFSAVASFAQTGSIAGTVTDSSGAIVQGAEVTVRNTATNEAHRATSSSDGTYSVTNLTVGPYEITAKKESFKLYRLPSIELTVAQTLTVDPKLIPGAASEEVTVRADQTQEIDLETSQISNLVDQRQMESLPLITRNPYQLVLLSPGTSQTDSSNGGISVNGARDRNNNFLLDGVDNNDTSVPGVIGGVLSANPDSTEEFRVITDNFNAEYGRNTGAIIDVVTKSGTNSLHGDVYYFGRWNGFGGARDWFNPAGGINAGPQNPYIRHQFGFSIGGPIIKNKTFFFFNEEFDRFHTTLSDEATVPTPAFLTGKFNYTYVDPSGGLHTTPIDLTPTGINNGTGLPEDPTIAKVFADYPAVPNSSSADGIGGTVFFPTTSKQSTYAPVVKLDHHFSDRESLSVRYGYNHFFDPNPGFSDILPGFGAYEEKSISEGLAAQLTSTLSNTLVNNFTFGWNHIYAAFYLSKNTTNILDAPGGVDSEGNGWDYDLFPFSSFASQLGGSDAQARKTGTISYSDGLSWVHGDHTFKFGFDFRDVGESGFDDFSSRRQIVLDPETFFGGFNPGIVNEVNSQGQDINCADLNAQGNPPPHCIADDRDLVDGANAYWGFVIQDSQSQFFNKAQVRQPSDNKFFKQHEFDWYAQDTWKIRPNFTLNVGLRYQLNGVPYETSGNLSNLLQDPGTFAAGQSLTFSLVGPGSGHQLYQPDYKDIEPRVGFSWDPWKDGKTAVRAGFGIFHDRTFGNAFGNVRADPPFQATFSNFTFDTLNGAFGSTEFPGQIPTQPVSASIPDGSATPGIVIFDTHFPNAASNNWNFDIQRQLPGNNALDVAYVGAMGVHVYGQRDGNPPDPNLVANLVAFCSNPNNSFTNQYTIENFGGPNSCVPSTVSSTDLYEGLQFGDLPYNAVNNNALLQPDYQINEFNSIYHGLQSKFTHRMNHGLQFQAAYTWSHALDNSVDPLTPAVGARTFPRNSRDLAQSYGNSDNDTRQVLVLNYVWELPFGRGKSHLSHGVMGRLMEGWEADGIFTAQTGHPFVVRGTRDSQRTGISAWGYQVGDPFGSGAGCGLSPAPGSGYQYITNQCAFVNPPFGSAANIERNQFYGPGFWDWDVTLAKRMTITERVKAELRFEGYNILNHPHFQNPGTDAAAQGNLIGQGQFGVITATYEQPDGTTSARQIQAVLKVIF